MSSRFRWLLGLIGVFYSAMAFAMCTEDERIETAPAFAHVVEFMAPTPGWFCLFVVLAVWAFVCAITGHETITRAFFVVACAEATFWAFLYLQARLDRDGTTMIGTTVWLLVAGFMLVFSAMSYRNPFEHEDQWPKE